MRRRRIHACAVGAVLAALGASPARAAQDDAPLLRARANAALAPGALHLAPTPTRDYDAPRPTRDALDFARAAAYTGLANYLVFQLDWFLGRPFVMLSAKDLERNFVEGFEWDRDPLQTNFFGHPLHGSFYFAGARAAGLSFWESVPYAFGGSLMWEFLGENELPSANDLLATSVGGIFLGEVMHRVSSQILDDSRSGGGRLVRELAAGVLDPPRGIDRLVTGEAWKTGDPPTPRYMRLGADIGIDRVRLANLDEQDGSLTPSLLVAAHVEYGDLVPPPGKDTIGPLETFDLYVAANLFQSQVTGAQVFEHGVLYGFSSNLGSDEGSFRDNNVFGFFQTFDFQGANVATFGALGFGPGDEVVIRSGRIGRLRFGASLEWIPVIGLTSRNVGSSPRAYNIGTGVAPGIYATWDLGRPGRLSFRSRQYVTALVDGARGTDTVGYARLAYEVDLVPELLGVGVAPTFTNRRSDYREGPEERGTQIATQLFLVVHHR